MCGKNDFWLDPEIIIMDLGNQFFNKYATYFLA